MMGLVYFSLDVMIRMLIALSIFVLAKFAEIYHFRGEL